MHRFSPRSGENRNRNVAISSKKAKQFEDRSVRKYQKGNSGDDKLRRCRFDLYPDLWKKRNDNVANCHRRKRNDNCGSVRKFQNGDDIATLPFRFPPRSGKIRMAMSQSVFEENDKDRNVGNNRR